MMNRRDWLGAAGLAGLASVTGGALAQDSNARHEIVAPDPLDATPPAHHLRFAVIGLDHYHIMSMTEAVLSGGGEVVAVLSTNTDGLKDRQLADFHAKFGAIRVARSEDEILQDPSIALVAAAPIPDQRAPLGIRVMRAGKDYLADKPTITTLKQLDAVRRAVAETGRKFAIMYSERLGVRSAVQAGRLIQAGARAATTCCWSTGRPSAISTAACSAGRSGCLTPSSPSAGSVQAVPGVSTPRSTARAARRSR